MAKKTTPEVKNEQQKVQTKYDRKMEARRAQEAKDKREDKIFKVVSALVGIALVAAIVIGVVSSVMTKQNALNGTYIKVGDREVSKLEFDYYYNSTVNSYLSAYSSFLPYMGLDTSLDFDEQTYMGEMTWEDMFEQMTVDQMTQIYALVDDANANGFTYDVETDFAGSVAGIEVSAEAAGVSVSEYCKSMYGKYATLSNIEPFIKDGILSNAYYNELIATNAPSDEEVTAYYEANKMTYDKVDYRSFAFAAEAAEDATEEEIAGAMEDAKVKADAFMAARQEGSDFETLCMENASEEVKANYEDAETEYCLSEGKYSSSLPSAVSEWLYDDARAAGDITVIEDTTYQCYYVVEFVNKYFDEADKDTISSQLSSEKVSEYLTALVEKYQVTDEKGNLDYLTQSAAAEDTAVTEETEAAAESTEAAESAETGAEEADTAETTAQ